MTNITHEVHNFLKKSPSIVRNIGEELINVRALAYYFLKKTKTEASVHAVMSAIRRYKDENIQPKKRTDFNDVYKESRISTKSRLVLIVVKRHFNILKNVAHDIFDNINVAKGEVLRIVEGRASIKFIIDNAKKKEIIKLIPKDEIIFIRENLGEVNIVFPEKYGYRKMHSLISPILSELTVNNINFIEIIGCMPELIFIVKEEEISKCHDVLLKFFYGSK